MIEIDGIFWFGGTDDNWWSIMFSHVELVNPCLCIRRWFMMIIAGSINEYCGNVKSPEFGGVNELMTDGWILWIGMIIYDMINSVSSWTQ